MGVQRKRYKWVWIEYYKTSNSGVSTPRKIVRRLPESQDVQEYIEEELSDKFTDSSLVIKQIQPSAKMIHDKIEIEKMNIQAAYVHIAELQSMIIDKRIEDL